MNYSINHMHNLNLGCKQALNKTVINREFPACLYLQNKTTRLKLIIFVNMHNTLIFSANVMLSTLVFHHIEMLLATIVMSTSRLPN